MSSPFTICSNLVAVTKPMKGRIIMKYTVTAKKSRHLTRVMKNDKYYKFVAYRLANTIGYKTFGEYIGNNTTVRDVFGY